MGSSQSVTYSVVSSESKEQGFSHVYRAPDAMPGLKEYPNEKLKTLQDIWKNSVEKYGDKPYLWTKNANGSFDSKSYSQCNEIAKNIGSAIISLNLAPVHAEWRQYQLKFVGIFAPNREEYSILDVTNCMYGNTMIPLYDSHGPENVVYCLKHTNMETVFTCADKIKTICSCSEIGNLKNVVLLDEANADQKEALSQKGLSVYTWQQLQDEGKKASVPFVTVQPDDIFTFSYTSGTTGDPKGVMLSHKNFASVVAVLSSNPAIQLFATDRHMSYLPAAHVFERIVQIGCFAAGASIYFSKADPKVLKDDLLLVKPTFFVSVPRLYNKFYDAITATFAAQLGLKKWLVDTAVKTKLANLKANCDYTHALWDKLVFNKVKIDRFGGSIRYMLTGSAPLSGEVCDFLKVAVGCPLIEGYGQTESTGASFTTLQNDCQAGHVGGPTINTEFRLADIPDMNYTSDHIDENGVPVPQGEICFRGPGIMQAYYKNDAKTDEAIINGWLHSGDVGSILPNGSVKIIDRKKNIFKLSIGEYIAPEKIEQTLTRHDSIDEIWVYGDSLQAFAVAVIHPNEVVLKKLGEAAGKGQDYDSLCSDPEINKTFLDNLINFGKSQKLSGFEIPRKVFLEKESLQVLGCITPSFKIQRAECKKTFQKQLDNLYANQ